MAGRRGPVASPRRAELSGRRGWSAISTDAAAMSTGTAALKTLWGSARSSTAADQGSAQRGRPELREPRALAGELVAVGDRRADRPRHQAHRVGDVGEHRRIPEREQRREGDQRARADDDVDGARRKPGHEDRECGRRGHGKGLVPGGGPAQQPGQRRVERAAPVTGAQHEGIGSQGGPRRDRREHGRQHAHPRADRARRASRTVADPRRLRDGRQRTLGGATWARPHRGARRRRGRAPRCGRGCARARHPLDHHVRLLDRELAPAARRGPLPDGLQRVPAPPPPRRAPREGCPDPLRRAARLAGPEAGAAADGRVDRADRGATGG